MRSETGRVPPSHAEFTEKEDFFSPQQNNNVMNIIMFVQTEAGEGGLYDREDNMKHEAR